MHHASRNTLRECGNCSNSIQRLREEDMPLRRWIVVAGGSFAPPPNLDLSLRYEGTQNRYAHRYCPMIKSLPDPLRLAFHLLLSLATFADSLRFTYVQREVVLERLHSCPGKDLDRQRQLQTYFGQAGCTGEALTLDQPKHSSFGNVVCLLAGTAEQRIVVGAHFDHAERGSGAVDNWSGASLLPSLYQAVATAPRKHTFIFIGFYGEERGLVGSAHYVHEAGKEQLA